MTCVRGVILFVLGVPCAGGANAMSPQRAAPASTKVQISGQYVGAGVVCSQFQLASGERISLSGAVPDMRVGERATLEGQWRELSKCKPGREFRVGKAQ